MDYSKLSVTDFLREARSGRIDLDDFYSKFNAHMKDIGKRYTLFITLGDAGKPNDMKGRLAGLPVAVKDAICTKGMRTTAGSRILDNYIPPFDATCVARIREESGVIYGKTTMDEFGFGTFSVNTSMGIPRNPIDPERACGGSSGGSAGVVKASKYPQVALGESTGGSISCPASFCGIVGMTPTYGLVSRYGLIDYANSLDKIGTMGKTVKDNALLLSVIAGQDPLDETSIRSKPTDYLKGIGMDSVKGLKIGIPKEYFQGVEDGVSKAVWDTIKWFESEGAVYKEISMPHTKYALPAYFVIAPSEASTNLARYSGLRYGESLPVEGDFSDYFSRVRGKFFGEEVKRRIILGTYARLAGYREHYYTKALKVRTLIIEEFRKAFKGSNVLITPTNPIVAPKFSEIEKMTHIQKYAIDLLTTAPNLAGVPHITVPGGTDKGMPVGVQIMGNHLDERTVFRVGNYMEEKR